MHSKGTRQELSIVNIESVLDSSFEVRDEGAFLGRELRGNRYLGIGIECAEAVILFICFHNDSWSRKAMKELESDAAKDSECSMSHHQTRSCFIRSETSTCWKRRS